MVDGKPGWVHSGLNPEVLTAEMLQDLNNPQSQYATGYHRQYVDFQKKVEDVRVVTQPSQQAQGLSDAQVSLLCGILALLLFI